MNPSRRLGALVGAAGIALLGAGLTAAPAEAQGFLAEPKAGLELVVDRTAYEAGATAFVAAAVRVEEGWHVNGHEPTFDYLIPTELELHLPPGFELVEIIYPPHEMLQFAFADVPIAVYEGEFHILAEITLPSDAAAGELRLRGVLRFQACDDRQCLPPNASESSVTLVVGAGGEPTHGELFAALSSGMAPSSRDPAELAMKPLRSSPATDLAHDEATAAAQAAAAATSQGAPPQPVQRQGLALILLLGVVGGLLLNAMPCVLPVLSLKVFGLVESAGHGRRHLVRGALATTAGIVLSFWLLATVAVAARAAGAAVGWGTQFQQPGFVAFLAVVVVLFTLNMWGLFEVPLPQSLARLGGSGPREGLAGHFASGLFATLMATPCSAPFLAPAIGFALTQSPVKTFAVFTAIGLGLALPYLTLAAFPASGRWLPKPGAWMVTFKHVMGFLLAATAVWLFYVLAGQVSRASLAYIQVALLGLALCVWLARGGRRLAAAGGALAAAGAIFLAATAPPAASANVATGGRIAWVAFDEEEAARLSADGRVVFVDFTADWCFTCKTTERLVLDTDPVAEAFERHDVVPMKADWTNRDDRITAVLARHGRSAVPFYLLYRPGAEPEPLGELLTKQRVIDAVAAASTVADLER